MTVATLAANLLPLGIASAIGPGQILFITLLLRSPDRGVAKAGAFIGGMTVVRLAQGLVFGFILTGATLTAPGSGQPGVITSTLLMVLGILLLVTAYRQWRQGEDPDAPPPKWLATVDDFSSAKALLIGAVLVGTSPNLWVFTLSAIATIGDARLSRPAGVIAFLLFVLVAELLVLLPLVIRIVLPRQAARVLDGISAWLTRHNRQLMIGVSVVFGSFFLVRGIGGLLAAGVV